MAPGLRADDAEGKPAPARTPRVFRLTTQKRRAIQRIASGDVLQGAAADCNSAGETHAWFDSRVAHHPFPANRGEVCPTPIRPWFPRLTGVCAADLRLFLLYMLPFPAQFARVLCGLISGEVLAEGGAWIRRPESRATHAVPASRAADRRGRATASR